MYRKHYTEWGRVPLLLTTDQAAILLQSTPENLRKLCRTGKLPAIQVGVEWRISRDSIRDLLSHKAGVGT